MHRSKILDGALMMVLSALLTFPEGGASELPKKRITAEEVAAWIPQAEGGDAEALYQLGLAYVRGEGVPKDERKAFEYFEKAQKIGHVEANVGLGAAYWNGVGVAKDAQRARESFQQAMERGSLLGKYNLAIIQLQSGGGESGRTEGLAMLKSCADQGLLAAQLELGDAYYQGRHGVAKDFKLAFEYYLKAAKQGDAYAQNLVGLFLRDRLTGAEDHAQAAEWFSRAADQGDLKARSNLGRAYLYGHGVRKDKVEAMAQFMAAKQEPMAQRFRNILAPQLTPEQIDAAKVRAKEINPLAGVFNPSDLVNGDPVFQKGRPQPAPKLPVKPAASH